ncbi:MAG TPA: hypothetical protein VF079_08365 [Sphingomicrobium sp.]
MENNGDFPPVKDRSWTRIEDYFEAMARRRTARRSRALRPRTEPEAPRFSLSTLPFLILIGGLAVLAVGIAVAAWPGSGPPPRAAAAAEHEQGFAPKGWYQDAEKEMRHRS